MRNIERLYTTRANGDWDKNHEAKTLPSENPPIFREMRVVARSIDLKHNPMISVIT